MKTLSIIIPAYNEARYIQTLLEKVLAVDTAQLGFKKEVIVIDDGSKDDTYKLATEFSRKLKSPDDRISVYKQIPNQGKGRAVQRGIRECTGDYVLIQDADLEYSPQDYIPMLQAMAPSSKAVAVYGSRTLGEVRKSGWKTKTPGKHEMQGMAPWGAGILLSTWTLLLYQKLITDTLTAYKLYPTKILKSFTLRTHGFETDHEITAKLIRAGVEIREVPIGYTPRSREEGKKIGAKDGFTAVWTLFKYRIFE